MLPSKLHIACAIAVVGSKPPDRSVKDYILHLREHVQSKRKPKTSGGPETNRGPDKHLNSASYWVQRFHQADAARTKLEVKVTEQGREIERLKSELRSVQKDSTRAPATTKRRKAEPPPGVSTRAAKRRKVVHEDSDTTDEDVEDTLPENMDALTAVNEEGTKLVQHLYQAHKHYKGHTGGDRQLAYHIVQAADRIAPLLTSACQRYHQRLGRAVSRQSDSSIPIPEPVLATYNNELISVFEGAARIFMSLFFGFKKLLDPAKSAASPAEERGAVIYSFVQMFSRVLDALKEVSSAQAAHEAALTLANNSKRQMTTRGSTNFFPLKQEDSPLATRLLSNFLSNILSAPSAAGSELQQQELFEGFLFVLFRRLGDRIFLCTFGHQKCASIADDIDAWVDPDPTSSRSSSPVDRLAAATSPPPADREKEKERQIAARALAIELPLLVSLLERGMAVAQRHVAPLSSSSSSSSYSSSSAATGPAASAATGGAASRRPTAAAGPTAVPFAPRSSSGRPPSSLEALRGGLSLPARKKLEQTLAHAIFGDEENASRDEMSECLGMPVKQALTEVVVPAGLKKRKMMEEGGGGAGADVKEWFVERVWGLVGWGAVVEMR
ncbi:Phosphatidylethanolamine-binding protein PEBP [Lasiodiplodia theobromae]|uniref:Phosphatidylethanolamine-binding protein PEBP n=1 Tax=Lasiodiplodia theobromae TaxID=45133 RepID=A0A8H7MAP5_9PEZI|nr:Phosphatidylethanolamine-binding protein PEBP [Lasiodiplodia theobromae]